MNYKLIAIDMDGTLLNSQNQISDNNKKILKLATEKGIQVVITTGRIYTSALFYAKLIGAITPIIACNGAYICEYHRNNVIYDSPIELVDIKMIIDVLEEKNMYYHFYDNENFYTRRLDYSSLRYYKWNKKQKPGDRINIEIVDAPYQIIKNRKVKVYKFVVMDKDKEKLKQAREILTNNTNIEIVTSMSNNFDIMNKGVSKGNSLQYLYRLFKIDRSKIIAIGDNENDISMIKFAGLGIAMGNATEELKKQANLITHTNNEDGVYKALKDIIL